MPNSQIPLQVKGPRVLSPEALFDFEQKVRNAPLQTQGLQQNLQSQEAITLERLAKIKSDKEKEQQEHVMRAAKAIVTAKKKDIPAVYKFIYDEAVKRGDPDANLLPPVWDDSLYEKFDAVVKGGLTPEQAIEQQQWNTTGQPQGQVPLSNIDQISGAQVRPYTEQPTGIPLSSVGEEEAFQNQLLQTGQAAAPEVGVTGESGQTPDGLRKRAAALEAQGGKVNFERAKDLRSQAKELDDRIWKEREVNKFTPEADIGGLFDPKTGEYRADNKTLTAAEVVARRLAAKKAGATNVNVGMNATDAAKTELLNQGIADMAEFKGLLFDKDGKVDRELVLGMNTPGFAGVPGTDSRTAYSLIYNAIEAKLRAESGAAVPEQEVKRMAARFIPSPIDSDETIRSKVRRMEAFLRGSFGRIKNAGEPTTPKGQGPRKTETAAPKGVAPKGVDQKLWDVMTPEEKKLWH